MNKIKLQLRAKHFLLAEFHVPCACAISFAAYDEFKTPNISEALDGLTIYNKFFSHEYYGIDKFKRDFVKALRNNFGDKVIRTIYLNPVFKNQFITPSNIEEHFKTYP